MGFLLGNVLGLEKGVHFFFYFHTKQKRKSASANFLFPSSIIHPFQHFQINLHLPVTISYLSNHWYSR